MTPLERVIMFLSDTVRVRESIASSQLKGGDASITPLAENATLCPILVESNTTSCVMDTHRNELSLEEKSGSRPAGQGADSPAIIISSGPAAT